MVMGVGSIKNEGNSRVETTKKQGQAKLLRNCRWLGNETVKQGSGEVVGKHMTHMKQNDNMLESLGVSRK